MTRTRSIRVNSFSLSFNSKLVGNEFFPLYSVATIPLQPCIYVCACFENIRRSEFREFSSYFAPIFFSATIAY
jgi:hypothetical protein